MVNKSINISDELVNITDAQLQKRLKDEFNFVCGPITGTTKSIYIKKLQELINSSTTTSTASTSTTKTKSTPIKTPVSTPKTRRKTIASPVIAEPEEPEVNPVDEPKITRRQSVGRSPTRGRPPKSTTVAVKKEVKNIPISSFSDTETEDFASTDKPTNSSINGATALDYSRGNRLLRKSFNNRISSITKSISPKDEDPLARQDNSSSDEKSGGVFFPTRPSSTITNQSTTPISSRAFRLFNRKNTLSNYSDSENEEVPNNLTEDKKDSNTLTENITKRLLRHRVTKVAPTNKDYSSKYLNSQNIVSQVNSNDVNQLTDSYSTQWNWISYSILIAGILFFAFIFSFYFYSRYFSASSIAAEEAELNALEKEFDLSIHELNIPGCLKKTNDSTVICSTNQIRPVLLIIKEMKKIVDKRLTNYYCSSSADKANENPYEYQVQWLRNQLEVSIGKNVVEIELQVRDQKTKAVDTKDLFSSIFANALDLLENNSKWFMKPIGENGKFERIVIDPNYPKTLHPTCQVKLFMLKTFWYFIILATLSAIGFLIYLYINRLKNQALKEKELLFELVEKSIELLQSPDEPQSLPILHIRDMLLNPQQRKMTYYQKIWDQVVHFIENNESRIKSSLENIDGEDYKTWKWVASTTNQPDSTAVLKASSQMGDWQSNIFSDDSASVTITNPTVADKTTRPLNTSTPKKNTTSVISTPQLQNFVALTRFLKVRNVVDHDTRDSDDDWKINVRNGIIQRCCKQSSDGKTHGLQHIHIEDRNINDSLVYIKCDSIESASNAFKALHGMRGWRNDDELISVKFLKEERYNSRFPEAPSYNKILKLEDV